MGRCFHLFQNKFYYLGVSPKKLFWRDSKIIEFILEQMETASHVLSDF